jgi:hypothetical protein
MTAKLQLRHVLGMCPFDQARASSVVERDFEAVLISKLICKQACTLVQGGFLLFVALFHEAIQDFLWLTHEFLRDPQLAEARAGKVIFVIAK